MKGTAQLTMPQLTQIHHHFSQRIKISKRLDKLTDKALAANFNVSMDTIRVAVGLQEYKTYKNQFTRSRRGFRKLKRRHIYKLHTMYQEKLKLLKLRHSISNKGLGKQYGVHASTIQRVHIHYKGAR